MKRFLAMAVAAMTLFSVLSLTSCSQQNTGTATGSTTTGSTVDYSGDTLDPGTLVIGVDDSYPPMEYKDTSGNLTGFDVEMANEIGKRMGKKVEYKSTLFDGIFAALDAGKFDCVISSVSITDDRLKSNLFTDPYIANAQMIVVKPDDNSITKAEDLAGKTVGVQLGTTADTSAETLLKKGISFTPKKYNEIIQTFSDMNTGRLNAIIVDEVVGEYYIAKDPTHFKEAAVKLTNEPIGVCFKKTNTKLRDDMQAVINEMYEDGFMKNLSIKWFGKDLTSGIDKTPKELS